MTVESLPSTVGGRVSEVTMVCGSTPVDVTVLNEGTILLFRPITEAGREWIAANVQDDAQWFAGALVVEHRYASDLYHGMVNDGLTVSEG